MLKAVIIDASALSRDLLNTVLTEGGYSVAGQTHTSSGGRLRLGGGIGSRLRALVSGIIQLTQWRPTAIDALAEIAMARLHLQIFTSFLPLAETTPREGGDPINALRSTRRLRTLKANKFCRKLDPRLRGESLPHKGNDDSKVNNLIPDTSAPSRGCRSDS